MSKAALVVVVVIEFAELEPFGVTVTTILTAPSAVVAVAMVAADVAVPDAAPLVVVNAPLDWAANRPW